MAKKKSNKLVVKPADMEDETAYLLTKLFAIINPAINPGAAYPIVMDMVHDGLGEDNLEMFGELIRATAFDSSETTH